MTNIEKETPDHIDRVLGSGEIKQFGYSNFYRADPVCWNCHEKNLKLVKKGVALQDVFFPCTNRGCTITGTGKQPTTRELYPTMNERVLSSIKELEN